MKIATWNVNSLTVRLPQVLEWLERTQPDVLALQETKVTDDKFPLADLRAAGYEAYFSGQKTYNGVALITKHSADDLVIEFPDFADPQRRIIAASVGDIRVINFYVPNGAAVDSEKYIYKLAWLERAKCYLESELARFEKVIVLGDFNIAPKDDDVHDPKAWEGSILVSPAERAKLSELYDLGFVDVFRLFEQSPKSFSWWDYRAAAFRRNQGLRIDLILASPALAKHCIASAIDIEPRKSERPSDHTPVLAEFLF